MKTDFFLNTWSIPQKKIQLKPTINLFSKKYYIQQQKGNATKKTQLLLNFSLHQKLKMTKHPSAYFP